MVSRILKQAPKETKLEFQKVMTVPTHLFGSASCVVRDEEVSKIQATEIKFLSNSTKRII
jgi:hypothetical protein